MHAAPHDNWQLVPSENVFITLPDQTLHLDCCVHCLSYEVHFVLETLRVPEVLRVTETLLNPLEHAAERLPIPPSFYRRPFLHCPIKIGPFF